MQYCIRCAYPSNHALGISFDNNGLCSGCNVHEEKDYLDWKKREESLRFILEQYRAKNSHMHDCIIPVTGGKDSFFIVDLIKNKYNLNPLLVSYNRFYNTKAGIYNLERIRSEIGCDIITMSHNPESVKKLIKYTVKRLGSIHWPFLAGSTVFPVQMAVKKRIPLIIWGSHQGLDQVGMFSHLDDVEMTRRYRKDHDLLQLEPEDILEEIIEKSDHEINQNDIMPLLYPTDEQLYEGGVRGIYLGNYIPWDTKNQHEKISEKYSVYKGQQLRTFDAYNDIDCRIYSSLHDEIKYRKFGYSKINDHVAREIRFGRISLQEGLKFIQIYQQKKLPNFSWFFNWIGIDEYKFWAYIDSHRSSGVWKKENETWSLKCSPNQIKITEKHRIVSLKKDDKKIVFEENTPSELLKNAEHKQLLMRGGAKI